MAAARKKKHRTVLERKARSAEDIMSDFNYDPLVSILKTRSQLVGFLAGDELNNSSGMVSAYGDTTDKVYRKENKDNAAMLQRALLDIDQELLNYRHAKKKQIDATVQGQIGLLDVMKAGMQEDDT